MCGAVWPGVRDLIGWRQLLLVQVNETFDLVSPSASELKSSRDYAGTVVVHVSAESALEEYCRGCRVLKVRAVSSQVAVSSLPVSEWSWMRLWRVCVSVCMCLVRMHVACVCWFVVVFVCAFVCVCVRLCGWGVSTSVTSELTLIERCCGT